MGNKFHLPKINGSQLSLPPVQKITASPEVNTTSSKGRDDSSFGLWFYGAGPTEGGAYSLGYHGCLPRSVTAGPSALFCNPLSCYKKSPLKSFSGGKRALDLPVCEWDDENLFPLRAI